MICCVSKTMCQQNNVSSKVCQLILVESSLMCPTKVTHNGEHLRWHGNSELSAGTNA